MSKLIYIQPPPPNRPEVTRAIWWATMERCREAGCANHLGADGSGIRKLLGIVVLIILALAAVGGFVAVAAP